MFMENLKIKIVSLLRWSERYTKTDMLYLAKGGFWLTFGQVLSTIASFLLAVAFANFLPSNTYGVYQFILSTAGILSATTLSGINTSAIRSVSKGFEGVILKSLKTKLMWSSIGSFVSIFISIYYFVNQNNTLGFSFLIVSIFLPFFYSLNISNSLLRGKKFFDKEIKYSFIAYIFTSASVITTLFLTNNIFVILISYFGSWTAIRYFIFRNTIKNYKTNDLLDKENESYGKHLSVIGFISTVSEYIDKILIFHFMGAVEVAIYSFATAPVMQIRGLMKNIHTLALPKFSERSYDEVKESILKRNFLLLLFSLPFFILYVFMAPAIFKLFFPQYLDSIFYSRIFALIIPISAFSILSSTALESRMEIKRKYFLSISSKLVKIVGMVALVIPYGIMGIVMGMIIANLYGAVVSIFLVKK